MNEKITVKLKIQVKVLLINGDVETVDPISCLIKKHLNNLKQFIIMKY